VIVKVMTCAGLRYLAEPVVLFGLTAALMQGCGRDDDRRTAEVIARVGDRTITREEFIQRAEYTPRPPYCRGISGLERKIILNSLLAEKMLALEAGDSSPLVQNPRFRRFIQGRTEQAMRQVLVHEEGISKVVLDTAEVRRVFRNAGRTYTVEFLKLSTGPAAREASAMLRTPGGFERVSRELLRLDSIPVHDVSWSAAELPATRLALFGGTVRQGDVIGPLAAGEDGHLVMRVRGWTDRVAITSADVRDRQSSVEEALRIDRAEGIYAGFIASVMRGRSMEFDRQTFEQLANTLGAFYFGVNKEKSGLLLDQTFNRQREQPETDSLARTLEAIKERTLCRMDGTVWTVRQFVEEFERHPLVFRKKKMRMMEFGEQLRLAIADMMRDRALTDEAYRRGYDKREEVRRQTIMWNDATLAVFAKYQYLAACGADTMDQVRALGSHLNRLVDSLQAKYADRVEVNVDAFNAVPLTKIDMFVSQTNVPFPVYVPAFPVLTTDAHLEYGKKMPDEHKVITF
jgi:hypothetical protein